MYAFPLKIKETTYKLFKFGKVVWAKKVCILKMSCFGQKRTLIYRQNRTDIAVEEAKWGEDGE